MNRRVSVHPRNCSTRNQMRLSLKAYRASDHTAVKPAHVLVHFDLYLACVGSSENVRRVRNALASPKHPTLLSGSIM